METKKPEIWAFAGGKGGTGKSLFTAAIAIELANRGNKIIAIDVDTGGGGLHNYFDWPTLEKNIISDFVSGRVKNLGDLADETKASNVKIIGGTNPNWGIDALSYHEKIKLLRAIPTLEADCVLLDLGPGINYNVLDFALLADKVALILLPELTSVENTYALIKALSYRLIIKAIPDSGDKKWLASLIQKSNIKHLTDLIGEIKKRDLGLGEEIERRLAKLTMSLIINQVREKKDTRQGRNIITVCENFIGIKPTFAGWLMHDDRCLKMARRKSLPNINALGCDMTIQIRNILNNLLAGTNAEPSRTEFNRFRM